MAHPPLPFKGSLTKVLSTHKLARNVPVTSPAATAAVSPESRQAHGKAVCLVAHVDYVLYCLLYDSLLHPDTWPSAHGVGMCVAGRHGEQGPRGRGRPGEQKAMGVGRHCTHRPTWHTPLLLPLLPPPLTPAHPTCLHHQEYSELPTLCLARDAWSASAHWPNQPMSGILLCKQTEPPVFILKH